MDARIFLSDEAFENQEKIGFGLLGFGINIVSQDGPNASSTINFNRVIGPSKLVDDMVARFGDVLNARENVLVIVPIGELEPIRVPLVVISSAEMSFTSADMTIINTLEFVSSCNVLEEVTSGG